MLSNINVDSKLLKVLQESTCFGIAYDPDVPECKQCDVRGSCKAKVDGAMNIPTPTVREKAPTSPPVKPTTTKKAADKKEESKPKETTPAAKKPATKAKPKPVANGNLPDFKPMSLDELKDLAAERNVEWKDYGNDQITRMRLIMNLKKSY